MTKYIPYIPYIPSEPIVIRKMLEVAEVNEKDIIYDLGAGDGRVLIIAVNDFNVKKAVGIEINDDRIKEAIENIEKNGVSDRASIIRGNFFELDISEATVVTLFLLTEVNEMLKPKFERELKPGTRVVSHEFEIPGWKPKKVEKIIDEKGRRHRIYLYEISRKK